jgi:phosphoribosyl 1,2-cyclic phosphodiesterase
LGLNTSSNLIMRIVVLGSGSGGNCTCVESRRTRLLFDAGFGIRSLDRRFNEAGLPPASIDGILITHGHNDHVAGVPSLVRRHGCVVYTNEGTRRETHHLANLDRHETLREGETVQIGDIQVTPFPTPHDAAQPVGYRIESEGIRGVLATDLGEVTPELIEHAGGCHWMVLESNHDEEMLRLGPYPWDLKRRVLGRTGHLSNDALADFLLGPFDGEASHLFLAHMSRKNNLPELAYDTASRALNERALRTRRNGVHVHLTDQIKPSIVITL